ncbi:HAMP domain-containing sensor histidine kinase [Fodinicola feengrottensis]|uniref:HAMP domain-containing sensor histidine kinase n=1 Tax=Fodinicola feengrottensis TaxID=435914 RepID=UPI0031D033F5
MDARTLGLRTRLLISFALLGVLTATLVAGAVYYKASNVILQKAQDTAVTSLTDRLAKLFPLRDLPPSQDRLDQIAGTLSNRLDSAVVVYRGEKSAGSLDPDMFPAELRQAVTSGQVVWQRMWFRGEPVVVVGTELLIGAPNGPAHASGLEVYLVHSLSAEQNSISQIQLTAFSYGVLALVFAVLLALLAARSVLRPVRELDEAARRLGDADLTTRLAVRGSDELARVAETFNNTADALERLVAELRRMEADARRFVADVSHELRTPLAAMTAVTDVLDEEAPQLPGDAGKAARQVSQETHNLTRLVNDLIEISRFDSGGAALVLDTVDVAAAIAATLRSRGWSDQVRTELPPRVFARLDPRRLDVMVANLVGNALRHGAPPISVRLGANADCVEILVEDHGPGLDPAVLPKVFDRFYKADTARTRSEGSGLGLAISWENARLHRDAAGREGSLVAGNREGGGAVFTLRLPREAHPGGK